MSELRTNEILEALRNVKPEYPGRGTPTSTTRELQSEGLIDIVVHDDGVIWHAELTSRGQKRLEQLGG